MSKFSKAEIRAIETIKKNWHVVEKALEADVVHACMGMTTNPAMSEQEMHFRRGAIFAAKNMLSLPDRLVNAANAQTAMESVLTRDDNQ